jgi:hypothetical protein
MAEVRAACALYAPCYFLALPRAFSPGYLWQRFFTQAFLSELPARDRSRDWSREFDQLTRSRLLILRRFSSRAAFAWTSALFRRLPTGSAPRALVSLQGLSRSPSSYWVVGTASSPARPRNARDKRVLEWSWRSKHHLPGKGPANGQATCPVVAVHSLALIHVCANDPCPPGFIPLLLHPVRSVGLTSVYRRGPEKQQIRFPCAMHNAIGAVSGTPQRGPHSRKAPILAFQTEVAPPGAHGPTVRRAYRGRPVRWRFTMARSRTVANTFLCATFATFALWKSPQHPAHIHSSR